MSGSPRPGGWHERGISTGLPGPPGYPASGSAILKIVDAETAPRRVFFGASPTTAVPYMYQQRLEELVAWAPISLEVEGR